MGLSELKSCSLSQGQPFGPRSVAMIWTSLSNPSPLIIALYRLCYIHTRMKVANSLADAGVTRPSVVSIGNFDGLHLGHREILKTVVDRARALGVQSVAMTFSPHPIHFLAPDRAPRLISTPEQKVELLSETGIDLLF